MTATSMENVCLLYARYICSRVTLDLNAAGRPSAARDDRVSCIQACLLYTVSECNELSVLQQGQI